MNLKDLFKKKKPVYNERKVDLNNDIYIDDEMKTFNPEEQSNIDQDLSTMTQNITDTQQQIHDNLMQQSLSDKLKADEIIVDFTPLNYNDIQKAAWMFQHAKKVVISFEKMESEDRSKTLNFFAGMMYALDGNAIHYSKNIYIFEIKKSVNNA